MSVHLFGNLITNFPHVCPILVVPNVYVHLQVKELVNHGSKCTYFQRQMIDRQAAEWGLCEEE